MNLIRKYRKLVFIANYFLLLILMFSSCSGPSDITDTDTKVKDTKFSVKRGFYDTPFYVDITTKTEGATIVYTLDGSNPTTSSKSFSSGSPARVFIDPESANGRTKTPGVILRAYAYKNGYKSTNVDTQTYLFLNEVTSLSPDNQKPEGSTANTWPDPFLHSQTNFAQTIDYGMDPDIYNDPEYSDFMEQSLKEIPSVSLVTDYENLFNPLTGIYMNGIYHGKDWERPVSMEILYPYYGEDVQIDAGLRIKGGWSRHTDNPKHAFRLFFRSEYGDGKLNYPLFGAEGVDFFDKIDLRTSQNYSWSYTAYNSTGYHISALNTMNRDVFSRDSQKDMGQPYLRSRYYHLYINGYYWGIYQSMERADARYAASYFGGDSEDYDVVKVDIGEDFQTYKIEATDGNLDAWNEVWQLCELGFDGDDENYYKLEGKDIDGIRDPGLKVLVDIDNLIDYMIIICYTGNIDAPTSHYGHNNRPNNFFAIYNRNNPDKGFIFIAIDNEHTLLIDELSETWMEGNIITLGIDENRVDLRYPKVAYAFEMNVTSFEVFHPQWLHYRLTSNAKYCARFDSRVKEVLQGNGALTRNRCETRFLSRAYEIDMAIIAESARWGDSKEKSWEPALTKADWQTAVNNIVDVYFRDRGGKVLGQLEAAGLYFP